MQTSCEDRSWLDSQQGPGSKADPDDINDSYYYAYVSKNGIDGAIGFEVRATAEKVGFGATGTTHHFTFDVALGGDEFIELWLWQEFFDPVRADMALTLRRVGG